MTPTTPGPHLPSSVPSPPSILHGMAVGLGTLAVLTALKLSFNDHFGRPTPFLLYFGAVLSASWYGGRGAGLLTSAAAALLGNFVFMSPHYALSVSEEALTQTTLFLFEGVVIALVTSWLQRERLRAATLDAEARTALAQLAAVLSGVDDGITMQDAQGKVIYANEAAARLSGFASARAFLDMPRERVLDAYELLKEDGSPFPTELLPSRRLVEGKPVDEVLLRFRQKSTGVERWSVLNGNAVRDASGALRFTVNVFRDVTEKRKREEEARLGQEWFATALRSIGDAVITTDKQGRVTFLNGVATELTGWSTSEAAGKPLADIFRIFNETTHEPVTSPVDVVLRDGTIVGLANHTVLEHRNGTEIAIDDSAAPIKTEAGELVGVVLVFRNVSVERRKEERKSFLMRAAEELNSSLDFEQTLATVARLAVPTIADWCAVDMVDDGALKRLAVAHVDPAKLDLVREIERRYPPEPNPHSGTHKILRTGEAEIIPEIPQAMLEQAARDPEHLKLIQQLGLRSYLGVPIKHGGKVRGVITLALAESKRIYGQEDLVFATALAERAGLAIENALLFRDAERLRAEAALQRDRLEQMIMAAPYAICVLRGPVLTFDLLNTPYRQRFSHARVGGPVAEVNLDAQTMATLQRALKTGEPFSANELAAVADYAGGRMERFVDLTVQPLRDAQGKVDRIIVFTVDVTEQVAARKRLEDARLEAELANRSKDEFLAMLGHELRNPLAPIITALQLMNLRAEGALARERGVIERQVKHVVRMVDDLLDVSRITRGKVELTRETIDLGEVVAKSIEMASPLFEQRKHHVTTSLPGGLFVDGDATRLAQVVANLLNNAAKYTEPGGHLFIGGERRGESVVLTVRDDGIGIAPEMLPRVFDLFVQERQALDRAQGGLGLGLAIVRSLVQLHGGAVQVRSDGMGKGSEFTVTLPAVAAPAATATVASTSATGVRKPHLRLMVVDDNTDALELLCESLEMMGYETLRASDGAAALVLAARERPAIGLLDIGLPAMDGYELARRLRELPGLGGIKLVALTGYGQSSDREKTAAAGFNEHLVKPASLQAVQRVLEQFEKELGASKPA